VHCGEDELVAGNRSILAAQRHKVVLGPGPYTPTSHYATTGHEHDQTCPHMTHLTLICLQGQRLQSTSRKVAGKVADLKRQLSLTTPSGHGWLSGTGRSHLACTAGHSCVWSDECSDTSAPIVGYSHAPGGCVLTCHMAGIKSWLCRTSPQTYAAYMQYPVAFSSRYPLDTHQTHLSVPLMARYSPLEK
jgi:hypothetical protein